MIGSGIRREKVWVCAVCSICDLSELKLAENMRACMQRRYDNRNGSVLAAFAESAHNRIYKPLCCLAVVIDVDSVPSLAGCKYLLSESANPRQLLGEVVSSFQGLPMEQKEKDGEKFCDRT